MRNRSAWSGVIGAGAVMASVVVAGAQSSGDSSGEYWSRIESASLSQPVDGRSIASPDHAIVVLDAVRLRSVLDRVPLERTGEPAVTVTLPLPDGDARFRVESAGLLHPALAAKWPDIRTWRGVGVDDPSATARLDWTRHGFHAMVLSTAGTVYVDPLPGGARDRYVSYYKRDYRRAGVAPLSCQTSDDEDPGAHEGSAGSAVLGHGASLRKYRLALACTGEYTAAAGGTVPDAAARMVTTMNRVDGIYEREVAVTMELVPGNDQLIYANPATDPYTNNNGGTMLGQNQTNLDNLIGSGNYDVGHVFSTGGGGVAQLGVICRAGRKAQGVTGLSNPVGDPFDVDYVAHEMGHQYGASHTFNGTTNACNGNRSATSAYEPGSGATIAGYAGICGAENLQPHSDDYFHSRSLDQIIAHITGAGNACAAITVTGNTIPTVVAGVAHTIPMGTPFELTAVGADADGDPLTYCWEERDLGTQAPPNTDNGNRPIFRSFNPVASPVRTFPRLADLLANRVTLGESLPTTTRTMAFRVTVRDNVLGAGAIEWAGTTVDVRATSGPFRVTAPNTAITVLAGSPLLVTWDVAGTTAAPVSAAQVDVLLSTDGGLTFPFVLLAGTANDGSEVVNLPCAAITPSARIKVKGSGNIFFDLSDEDFAINLPSGGCASCITSTLRAMAGLRGVKQGPAGVWFEWQSDPAAAEYHLNGVADKREIRPPASHLSPIGIAQGRCTAPGGANGCVDATAIAAGDLYYQVYSACDSTAASEGPF